MQRFILIDGNAIMHRAYHALPPLTTKDGRVTNAVYGFTTMLMRVIEDLHPSHLAVAFDRPEPTFRKKLLVTYQSHRPEMEDNLSGQFPIMKEVLGAMNIPIFELAGFEADDVIGTIAKKISMMDARKLKLEKEDRDLKMENYDQSSSTQSHDRVSTLNLQPSKIEVIIVTGDRDILQLVDDRVKVYMPVKGLSEAKLYDKDAVVEKFGLEPKQIIDYKALIGDSSDNYPGVLGIGPKTAVDLLTKYKTFEGVYKNINECKGRVKEKLESGKESGELSKTLATIITDAPVDIDVDMCKFTTLETPEVEETFRNLGFKSLVARVNRETNDKNNTQKKSSTESNQLSFF